MGIAVLLSGISLVEDCRHYKISNKIIISGFAVQLVLLMFDLMAKRPWITYVLGGLIAFLIMFFIYLLKGVGAGDVKIVSLLGMFLGLKMVCLIIAGSLCIGALIGMFAMFVRVSQTVQISTAKNKTVKMHGFHYSIAIVMAQCIVYGYYFGGV